MKAAWRITCVLALACVLAACGFHLRRSAGLPAGMDQVYLSVSGNGDFWRQLVRSLESAGSTVYDHPVEGAARLQVTQAQFKNAASTISSTGRISEYAVRFYVTFTLLNADGKEQIAPQHLHMSREFTYDPQAAIGRGSQVDVLQKSLIENMVQAVMFRLEAHATEAQKTVHSS